ncbi:unnamed protein product [Laminaria digitata]
MTKELKKATPKLAWRVMDKRTGRLARVCARNGFLGRSTGAVAGSGGFIGRVGGNGFSRVGEAGGEASPSPAKNEYSEQRQQQQQEQQRQRKQKQQQQQRLQQQRSHPQTPRQPQSSTNATAGASACKRRPADAAATRDAIKVDAKKMIKTDNKRRGSVPERSRSREAKKKNTRESGWLQGEGKESAGVTRATTPGDTKDYTPCAFEVCRARATHGVDVVRYCINHRLFGMRGIP